MNKNMEAKVKFADRVARAVLMWPDINSTESMINISSAFQEVREEAGYPSEITFPMDDRLLFTKAGFTGKDGIPAILHFREEVTTEYIANFVNQYGGDFGIYDDETDECLLIVDTKHPFTITAEGVYEDGTYGYKVIQG